MATTVPLYPYNLQLADTVDLRWYDEDGSTLLETTALAQWLKPYITMGSARETLEPLEGETGIFFHTTAFFRRVLLKTNAPIGTIQQFRENLIYTPWLDLPEGIRGYVVDSIRYRDRGDPDGHPVHLCLIAPPENRELV